MDVYDVSPQPLPSPHLDDSGVRSCALGNEPRRLSCDQRDTPRGERDSLLLSYETPHRGRRCEGEGAKTAARSRGCDSGSLLCTSSAAGRTGGVGIGAKRHFLGNILSADPDLLRPLRARGDRGALPATLVCSFSYCLWVFTPCEGQRHRPA